MNRIACFAAASALCLVSSLLFAQGPAGSVGWRGNWTGLYPDATPALEWRRLPAGATAGLLFQAAKPVEGVKGGQPVHWGQPTEWLVLAPIDVVQLPADFDKEQIPDEANLRPQAGDKACGLEWKLVQVPRFQGTEMDFVDVLTKDGKRNQVGYAHTWLWAERDGRARVVCDHLYGLKLWVNGKLFYNKALAQVGLGHVYGISRQKVALQHTESAVFEIDLRKGWNRVLAKCSTSAGSDWQAMRFCLRLTDDPPRYDDLNILWAAELPERTASGPIIVGDRIFTTAEPDELLCLDKKTGKILWRRTNSYYDAIPDAEKKTNPVLRDEVAPLAAQLLQEWDMKKAYDLRRAILEKLLAMDKVRFEVKWDGHMASHFGIVGFSTQPVSDGRNVYVFVGAGVVACYDFDGNRKWIRRIPLEMYFYTSSPAIAGGNLIVNCAGLHAFDLATGEKKWTYQGSGDPKKVAEEAWGGVASLISGVIRGVEVVVTQKGDVLHGADGRVLFANPNKITADTGWAPAAVIGDVVYLPWGAFGLHVFDFSNVEGDAWKPVISGIGDLTNNKLPNGNWVDRWTAAAPLIHDDIAYCFDIFGIFYAVDLKAKKLIYRQQLDFDSLDSYVHLGASASPVLGGKHIFVINNQGVCYVLAPGREFKIIAKNQILNTPRRTWPVPPFEVMANSAPIFDGGRMYLRGETCLYCIGKP